MQETGSKTDGEVKSKTFTDFVDSAFASFESRFKIFGSSNTTQTNASDEEDGKKKKYMDQYKSEKELDEEDAHTTFTYLIILTAIYLPFLLFLWMRGSNFGSESMVRSLFLSHILRFAVAFLLLPKATIKSFLPKRVWNLIVKMGHHFEEFWYDRRTQAVIPTWVHVVLSFVLGVQTDNQAPGRGALEKAKKNGLPLPLMCLASLTFCVFLVHPDGLTWIMFGQLRQMIQSSIMQVLEYLKGVRNGEIRITLSDVSPILASIVIIATIVNSIISNLNKDKSSRNQDRMTKNKHRKGKKGKGRNYSRGSTHSSKYKAKDSKHFENEIDSEDSMKSTSQAEFRRMRSLSDMETSTVSSGSTVDTTLPASDLSSHNSKKAEKERKDESTVEDKTNEEPKNIQSQEKEQVREVQHKVVASASDDEKSCSSSVATVQTEGRYRSLHRRGKGKQGAHKGAANSPFTPPSTPKRSLEKYQKPTNQKSISPPKVFPDRTDSKKPSFEKKKYPKSNRTVNEKYQHDMKNSGAKKANKFSSEGPRGRSFTAPEMSRKKNLSNGSSNRLHENKFPKQGNSQKKREEKASTAQNKQSIALEPLVPLQPTKMQIRQTPPRLDVDQTLLVPAEVMKCSDNGKKSVGWNETAVIRPPPGLELPAAGHTLGLEQKVIAAHQSTSTNQTNLQSSVKALSLPLNRPLQNDKHVYSYGSCDVPKLHPMSPLQQCEAEPSSFSQTSQNDDEIEADLRKMVCNILDF